MQNKFLKIAALLGALSVGLGAFAAHALKQIFAPDILQIFETAIRYQFYHVFALLAVGLLQKEVSSKLLTWSGNFFITGIVIFSGSLYALCFVKYKLISANWIGAITPLGGMAFIAGWLMLFYAIANKKQH